MSIKRSLLRLLILLAMLGMPLQAAVYYVDSNVASSGVGSSWATAKKTLGEALALAASGDQIWVKAGIYRPTAGTDRTISFIIPTGVAVYGGFAGGESLIGQRNPRQNQTILSGDIGTLGSSTDNSNSVIKATSVTGITLDGLIIRDGAGGSYGGGVNLSGVTGTIANCVVTGNQATFGGGLYSTNGNLTVRNSVFQGNQVTGFGGGVYLFAGAGGVFSNCVFQGNQVTAATYPYGGGALFLESQTANTTKFLHCTIQGNHSTPTGGAGGSAHYGSGNPSYVNCILWGNSNADASYATMVHFSGATSTATNSLFEGGVPAGTTASGTLTSNPQFANAASPAGVDGVFGTSDDGLFPGSASPVRNAGSASGMPTDDLRGRVRSATGGIDLGAYERGDAQILRVGTVGSGSGDGSSWANVMPSVIQALSVAHSGDAIWVRTGTYKPTGTADRTMYFNLPAGVSIYGGFAGSETLVTERNPRANLTVLSGEIGSAANTDNSYHVVVAGEASLIDGFVIRDGYADTASFPRSDGAGLQINGVTATVRQCVFSNNTNPNFTGGGISVRSPSAALIQGCVFSGNSGKYGGGAYTNAGARFENCIFNGNSSTFRGGALYNDSSSPGAVYANCHVTSNTSPAGSAAIHSQGTLSFINCLAWGNSTASLVGTAGTSTLTNCLVEGGLVSGFTSSGVLLTSDPQPTSAADPDGPDNIWGTADDGLFPQATSPARDAGTATSAPSDDIRGAARPSGNGFDIGSYERRVIYVDALASGSGSGSTWVNAATDLRLALQNSSSGDEIWVKAGTYKPTTTTTRTLSFVLPNGVGLYGGFNGTETSREARDWTANQVVLSGDIGTAAITDNSFNVLTANGTGVINGFIVKNGYNLDNVGTGVQSGGAGLTLAPGASPTVRNCIFENNRARYAGGAVFGRSASAKLENCLFVGNNAQYGGAVEFETSAVASTIVNCTFVNNTVTLNTGSGTALGTAIETASMTASVAVTNCVMWGNGAGNAIYNNGGTGPVVSFSLVQGSGGSTAWAGGTWGTDGGSNKDADPLFLAQGDADGADNLFYNADDGLLLLTSSPAANAGTLTGVQNQDIRRQPRPLGGGADMGCYEGQAGRVVFASAGSSVSESSASTSITVSMAAADNPLTVSYAVTGGTATNGIAVIPSGSAAGSLLPLYANYNICRTSFLYLAAELGGAQTYRSMSLELTGGLASPLDTVVVRMRHVVKSDYATPDWGPSTGWDEVYRGSLAMPITGHLVLNFNSGDNRYIYDGTSNLEVDVSLNTATTGFSASVQASGTGSTNRTIYYLKNDDASTYGNDPTTWQGTGDAASPSPFTGYNNVPKIRFSTITGGGLADYTLASGTLTFSPGQTALNIPVTILPDAMDEPDETVVVTLANAVGGSLGTTTVHTLTITNDDSPPVVQFTSASGSGSESVANPVIGVSLSAISGRTVRVNYAGTVPDATDGSVVSGQLVIPAGSFAANLPAGALAILDDAFDEDDESAQMTLSLPVPALANCTLGTTSIYTHTIQDNDATTLQVSQAALEVTESNLTPVTFTIALGSRPYVGAASDALVRLDITAQDGTEVEVSNNNAGWSSTTSLWFSGTGTGNGQTSGAPSSWSAAKTIYVRSKDDDIQDGDIDSLLTIACNAAGTADTRYKVVTPTSVAMTTHDDADTAGFTIAQFNGLIPVGTAAPIAERIWRTPSNPAELGPDITFTDVSGIRVGMYAFNPNDGSEYWVAAVNTGTKVVTLTTVIDGNGVSDWQFGAVNVFLVTTNTMPTGSIKLAIASASTRVSVWPETMTLNPGDSGYIYAYPIDNDIADGDDTIPVQVTVADSDDSYYRVLDPTDPTVYLVDDDVKGVTISPTAVAVTEGGSSASYQVVLSSQPTGNVTVTPQPGNGRVAVGSALTFTTANWNVAQSIAVTADNDEDLNAVSTCTITNVVAGSDYASGVTAASVLATVTDNESATPIVTPTSGLVTGENGTLAAFTISLAARPDITEVISIPITVLDATEGEFWDGSTASGSVTVQFSRGGSGNGFSAPALWSSDVTVTLRGVNDGAIDGDVGYTVQTAATSSSLGSGLLHAIAVEDVSCTNVDDEVAGVQVIGGSLNVTEGAATATYGLKLSFLTADIPVGESNVVQVTLSTTSPDIQISPQTVLWYGVPGAGTFTATQTITITAVDDQIDEALENAVITHVVTATSKPALFPFALAIPNAQAAVADNDVAGVDLLAPAQLIATESGGTTTFSVRLRSQPVNNVSIGLTLGGDTDEILLTTPTTTLQATGSLLFTNANWSTPQQVTVTGQPDSIDDGDRSFTIITGATSATNAATDPSYVGLAVADLAGVNTDRDTVGITLSKTAVTLVEGGATESYTLVPSCRPNGSGTVTVTFDGNSQVEFLIPVGTPTPVQTLATSVYFASDTVGTGAKDGSSLTNLRPWNQAITVTARAIDDRIDEATSHAATIRHTVTGADFTGVAVADIAATITDSATYPAGVTVSTIPATLVVAEAAGTGTIGVVLNSKPTDNVYVDLAAPAATLATLSSTRLTFTPSTWNVPQSVTVTGVDDNIDQDTDGNQANDGRTLSVPFTLSSSDDNYEQRVVTAVAGTVSDEDTAGITIAPVAAAMTVSEAGGASDCTIVLNRQPVGTVTVPLAVSNIQRAVVSVDQVVFTPANWNVAQTVTVTGRDLDGTNDSVGTTVTLITGDPSSTVANEGFDRLAAADVADLSVTSNASNAAPRVSLIADTVFAEGAVLRMISIASVDSGQTGESQDLTISAVSSDPALIPSLTASFAATPALPTDQAVAATLSFTPAASMSGTATITVTVTDDASIATDAVARTTIRFFTLTITPVNDPPVASIPSGAVPVHEEAGTATLVLSTLTLSDVDSANLSSATVAITNRQDGTAEQLQATTTGTAIVASYDADAGVLSLNAASPQPLVLFQQVLRTVAYRTLSDDPETTVTRLVQVVVNDGSDNSTAVTSPVMVTATNDPPVLSGTAVDLATIAEDVSTAANPGKTIDAFIAGTVAISDPDDTARGVAFASTGGDVSGSWYYSINAGGSWTVFPSLAAGHLVLPADGSGVNRIRFVPDADQNGTATVTWRAWDTTDAAAAGSVVAVVGPGSSPSPFSASTLTSSILVAPANDAPALADLGAIPPVAEDSTNPVGVAIETLIAGQITDIDLGDLEGVAVVGLTGMANGSWQYTLDAGVNWLAFGTVSDASATLLAASGSTVRIRYVPNADFNGTATISCRAWDQSNGLSSGQTAIDASLNGGATAYSPGAAVTATVTVTPVNDAPVLVGISGSSTVLTMIEDESLPANQEVTVPAVISRLSAADVDSGDPQGVAVVGVDESNGTWWFNVGAGWVSLSTVADGSARVLPSAPTARVRFQPNADFNGSAGVTVRLWDQNQFAGAPGAIQDSSSNGGTTAYSAASATLFAVVTPVNDPPAVDLNGGGVGVDAALAYLERDPARQIAPGASLSDIDSVNLVTLSVAFADVPTLTENLAATTDGTLITQSYSGGTLSLTGVDTVANYLAVLRSITYADTSRAPALATRTLTVVASDGTAGPPAVCTIIVTAVNDAPVLVPASTLAATVGLGDPVGITTAQLDYTDADGPIPLLVKVLVLPSQGVLLLNGAPVTVNALFPLTEIALGNLVYDNNAITPIDDAFAIRAVDSAVTPAQSDVSVFTIAVTGLPPPSIAALAGDATTWTENQPAVAIDLAANAVVDDPAALLNDIGYFTGGSMRVEYGTRGYQAGDLIALDTAGAVSVVAGTVRVGGVDMGTVVSNGVGGNPLQITFLPAASEGLITTLVQAVGFSSSNTIPVAGVRDLRLTIDDGTSSTDAVVDATVTVVPVDDPPTVTDQTIVLVPGLRMTGLLQASDEEGQTLTYQIDPGSLHTKGVPVMVDGTGVATASNSTGGFAYTSTTLDATSDTFTIIVTEAGGLLQSSTATVTVIIAQQTANGPRITSSGKVRTTAWDLITPTVFSYTPTVAGFTGLREYRLMPTLSGCAGGVVAGGYTFTGGMSTGAPGDPDGTITIPNPVAPDASGYLRCGILVIDHASTPKRATYQPILIKIAPGASG